MSTSLEKLQSKNISHKDSTMDYRKSATLFLETLAETSAKYQKSKECSGNNAYRP
ncbi:hypothetical protein [Caldalkalibacillus mannanilyticus]|uniref:hypothetical protein n=1 Tax=Caldalkalibacillus mannanilyticus TaxID=1418 RepID=UPI00131F3B21|nr:hypothetical protein [Caldalkalibacillus mannanilyticus]